MIRMILADDEPVITRGIRKLLDWERLGIEIIGEYEDGKRALEAIVSKKPEIALLDISMPGVPRHGKSDSHYFCQRLSGF